MKYLAILLLFIAVPAVAQTTRCDPKGCISVPDFEPHDLVPFPGETPAAFGLRRAMARHEHHVEHNKQHQHELELEQQK